MKLLVDMNLSPRWAKVLMGVGWQAVHWSTFGKANAPDTEILDFARVNGFLIPTNDLDFATILAVSNLKKPSVIQIRAQDLSPEAIGHTVVAAIFQAQKELEIGAILTIEPDRTRLRVLPLEFEPLERSYR